MHMPLSYLNALYEIALERQKEKERLAEENKNNITEEDIEEIQDEMEDMM